MVDTVMWLVDDSKFLTFNVSKYNVQAPLPIDLDTLGLAILLPGLKKYGKKGIYLYNVRCYSHGQHIF